MKKFSSEFAVLCDLGELESFIEYIRDQIKSPDQYSPKICSKQIQNDIIDPLEEYIFNILPPEQKFFPVIDLAKEAAKDFLEAAKEIVHRYNFDRAVYPEHVNILEKSWDRFIFHIRPVLKAEQTKNEERRPRVKGADITNKKKIAEAEDKHNFIRMLVSIECKKYADKRRPVPKRTEIYRKLFDTKGKLRVEEIEKAFRDLLNGGGNLSPEDLKIYGKPFNKDRKLIVWLNITSKYSNFCGETLKGHPWPLLPQNK